MRLAIPTAVLVAVGLAVTAGSAVADQPPPHFKATAAALIEESTGHQLYGLDANRELPVASTTKLMTALLTLEHVHKLGTVFTQNDYYATGDDSRIGLVPGERMSVHDLLLALLLPSADDAAEDLAYNIGHGSVARFVGMMNARARELGLAHTHYSNPVGFDTPPGNYSSASDLVRLARYVLGQSAYFRRVVALPRAVLFSGRYIRTVTNLNDLVGRVPWINGVKTGHTMAAGYVLVGSGTRHGMTLISAVLGTGSASAADADTLALLDYGFANFVRRTPVTAGALAARVPVDAEKGKYASLVAAGSFSSVFPRSMYVHTRLNESRKLIGPLRRHAVVGSLVVLAGARKVASVPVVLAHALAAPAPEASALSAPATLLWLVAVCASLIGATVFWRRRVRGRRGQPER